MLMASSISPASSQHTSAAFSSVHSSTCSFMIWKAVLALAPSGQVVLAEQSRVDGLIEGVRHSFQALGGVVPHHVLVVAAAPQLVGAIGELGGVVHEERQVGPLRYELVVVQILVDDVAHPGQHEGHVGARANGQPHVGAGRIRREARVDDHGLHTGISQLRGPHWPVEPMPWVEGPTPHMT